MKPSNLFHRLNFGIAVAVLFISAIVSAAVSPSRLDLYDVSENHLMFVTFEYDGEGRNSGRTVFMSDSTFVRRVVINYNADGMRLNEVSYNFNDDTSFVTSYQSTDDGTAKFSIVDQFKVDQVGGAVSYSKADPLNFDLLYQKTGASAAKVIYEQDGEGNLSRVNITDASGVVQYIGVFDNGVGVKRSISGSENTPPAVVTTRGASMIDIHFNLRSAADVRCELLTLSGRRANLLYSGPVKQGSQTKSFRLDGASQRQVAGGVYLLMVSVDGVTVSCSRYLHQNQASGGVR